MPTTETTEFEFDEDDISIDEIASAIKKSRSKSSPSPFDEISFKKCWVCSTACLLHGSWHSSN